MGVLREITSPYSRIEGWVYDTMVAPTVVRLKERLMPRLLDEVPPGGSVLDVGCGGGQVALAIAERRPDLRVTGLDLSADQVRRATARARRAGAGVAFVQGSALALPYTDRSFDAVVSVASIKHWPDQARGVAECARVSAGLVAILEADRGCRLEDAAAFVQRWRVPAPLRPVALAAFRTWVVGQSLDLDDARGLLAAAPEHAGTVDRIPGAPALLILLRREGPAQRT